MRLCKSVTELFEGCESKRPKSRRTMTLLIHPHCSLKCPYCVNNMGSDTPRPITAISTLGVDGYLAKLDAMVANWDLTAVPGGGEATESPYFVDLASGLLERGARVHLETNTHGVKNVEALAKRHDLTGRVISSTSYHLGAYLDHGIDPSKCRARIARLAAAGVTIGAIITPMSPPVLADPQRYLDDVESILEIVPGARVVPFELYHWYKGSEYPRSYTEAERSALASIRETVSYKVPPTMPLSPAITPHLQNWLVVPGQPCWVANYRATVGYGGRVRLCNHVTQTYAEGDLFGTEAIPCPGTVKTGCKQICVEYCLAPMGVTLGEYFFAWYSEQGEGAKAKVFAEDGDV